MSGNRASVVHELHACDFDEERDMATRCECSFGIHAHRRCPNDAGVIVFRPRRWGWLDRALGPQRLAVCDSCTLTGDRQLKVRSLA